MNGDPSADEALEPERYELSEEPRYRFDLNRRAFVQILGAGLLVTVNGGVAFGQRPSSTDARRRSIAARLHVGQDGVVTVLTGKVDAGQGSRTQISQAAAEELRVAVDRIHLIMADTGLVPNDGGSYGSLTTPRTVPVVRRAAAAAREALAGAACKQWNCKRKAVEVREGAVVHAASKRRLTYEELAPSEAAEDAFAIDVPREIELTPVSQWDVLGTPVPKTNGRAIVTGAVRYPSDIVRPGMLYGRVLRPPSFGATLSAVNLDEADAMDGVVTVREGAFVGCAAPTSYQAGKALEAIAKTARWDTKPHPSSKELFTYLKDNAQPGGTGRSRSRTRTRGSVEDGLAAAATTLSATYEIPYIQHAPMEPRAAAAEWNGDALTVWTGTQRPFGVQQELAQAFSIPRDRVRVIVPTTGGCFGGKHTGDAAVEAARLARTAGRPISLRWTREEEFTWAYFRPAGVIDITAGLDKDGALTAWDFTNINSGGSALDTPYAIANTKAEFLYCDPPLRQGSYRALASTANNFARESFMDELAAQAGADPLEFRLAHLEDPRLRAVLEAAADKFDWVGRRKRDEPGVGIGLACGTEKASFVAACVEIRTGKKGEFSVHRVCEAFECGAIQNPVNLSSQVEGCIIMGLGGALTEAIDFENGAITNASFRRYPVPRFEDVPELDIHLVDRPGLPSVGAGETPIMAVAPAIANALYHATGERRRALPLHATAIDTA